jgi:DNA-binding MarR family transcriptional regulator/N-acetylglutamate synthase-like GNAT family acetyltransferase
LANREGPTAAELGRDLGIDRGYLSRILRGFDRLGLIARTASPADGRRVLLGLTPVGRSVFGPLDARSGEQVEELLSPLSPHQRQRLAHALSTAEAILDPKPAGKIVLRPPRSGDYGWVIQRHGALYADEWGYNQGFEALVARIVSDFAAEHDPRRERCWIADRVGEPVGSVFLVRKSQAVAKLRCLLIEPEARVAGLGKRLVAECIRFAREAGYRRIQLWTYAELAAAGAIYRRAGFRLVEEHAEDAFGRKGLLSQTWELSLAAGTPAAT